MANAMKRKGSKIGDTGGLGGPGGRTGTRALTRRSSGVKDVMLTADMLHQTAPNLARAVKREADRRATTTAVTPYRMAMSALAGYANEHSKNMKPEMRVKLARAKDELRALYDQPHEGKGAGGPGAKRAKPKVKSRRTERASGSR